MYSNYVDQDQFNTTKPGTWSGLENTHKELYRLT